MPYKKDKCEPRVYIFLKTSGKFALLFLSTIICSHFIMEGTLTLKKLERVPPTKKPQPLKTILFWNPLPVQRDFNFGFGRRPFLEAGCPETRCSAFSRRNVPIPVENFDAVVFKGWNFPREDEPLPEKRRPEQRYILYLTEPPEMFPNKLGNLPPHFFNWTLNYRLDSDVIASYGIFRNISQTPHRTVLQPTENWMPSPHKYPIRDLPPVTRSRLANRTGVAAWLVSNCKSHGRRERYIKELRRYMKVDVYGQCGSHKCDYQSTQSCYRLLGDKYKFYLAFENSFCKDYVSEKVFYALAEDMVPIVYGAANYSKFVPPRSYIEAKDFTPVQLARYLHHLNGFKRDYLKYFWWKQHYEVQTTVQHHFCNLCAKLHEDSKPKSYGNVSTWYRVPRICYRLPNDTSIESYIPGTPLFTTKLWKFAHKVYLDLL